MSEFKKYYIVIKKYDPKYNQGFILLSFKAKKGKNSFIIQKRTWAFSFKKSVSVEEFELLASDSAAEARLKYVNNLQDQIATLKNNISEIENNIKTVHNIDLANIDEGE